jgi:hypothetical protein
MVRPQAMAEGAQEWYSSSRHRLTRRHFARRARDATDALKRTEDTLILARVTYDTSQNDLSPVLQLENVVSATQTRRARTHRQAHQSLSRIEWSVSSTIGDPLAPPNKHRSDAALMQFEAGIERPWSSDSREDD